LRNAADRGSVTEKAGRCPAFFLPGLRLESRVRKTGLSAMTPRSALPLLLASFLTLAGCATRPVNPPLEHWDPNQPLVIGRPGETAPQVENLVILAFSGGGTRAAAFSYGVLEALRDIDVVRPPGPECPR